jgi:phage repressor protein C with HTH and peptisase S24 domain
MQMAEKETSGAVGTKGGLGAAYAVRVRDNLLSPAFKPGHILHVDPSRPVMAGDHVVIQTNDGQAFIKELASFTDTKIVCGQHNPQETMEFAAGNVRALHKVVGASFVES